jgi:hypothetical protein
MLALTAAPFAMHEHAAHAAAAHQLNAAALAQMLSHAQPGQQYAQGALAQLLAFGAGQPVWPGHAMGGVQMQLQQQPAFAEPARADAASPGAGEERAGKTTNYAARHQARGATSSLLYPYWVTPQCHPRTRRADAARRLRPAAIAGG